MAYLFVVIFPAGLLALYALFRWRYVNAIKNTIYPPMATAFDVESSAASSGYRAPLTLKWTEPAGIPEQLPCNLAEALAATRDIRGRFFVAGAAYLIAAAIVVWHGQQPNIGSRAAVSLAYWSTLPSVFVLLAFLRPGWRTWLFTGIGYAAAGLLLLIGPLGVSWRNALGALYAGVDYASYALVAVGLLVWRKTRTLLVGFVPLIGLWFGLTALCVVLLQAIGISLDDLQGALSVSIAGWGLAAVALGLALGVRQIRRGLHVRFVLALIATFGASIAFGFIRWTLISAFIGSVAFHALFTLAVWYLFMRFLRLKAKGLLPDEVLHFSFCWFALTTLLPVYAGGSALFWPLPITAYAGTLFVLLSRHRRRAARHTPKRMLLLRVFSREAMRSRLLDLLDDSWRRAGRIDLVVGVDLAIRTLSAAALENFLLGRVDRQFVRATPDVDWHLASLRNDLALDGRYPLNELHCLPGVWQHVVSALAGEADVVLMDLRGFRETNRGVVYELSLIMRRVPLARTVLLTDRDTDEHTLTKEVLGAWSELPSGSPSVHLPDPQIELLRCSGARLPDARAVLTRVFTAAFTPP
jgi:hypothetical protein